MEGKEEVILYSFHGSFHGQKVLLALLEKNVSFKNNPVSLFKGEHLSPSFLKLNPKGLIPVLQMGKDVITESSDIIDYLDRTFRDDNHPVLIPPEGSESYEKMIRYLEALENIRISLLTFGTCAFPQLTSGLTISDQERQQRLAFLKTGNPFVDMIFNDPETKILVEEKKRKAEEFAQLVGDINEVENEISSCENVMEEIEKNLSSRQEEQKHWWLCGEQFTKADIYLAIILLRLRKLGLDSRLVSPRASLKDYVSRLVLRPAVKTFSEQLK